MARVDREGNRGVLSRAARRVRESRVTPTIRLVVVAIAGATLVSLAHRLVAFNLLDWRWPPGQIDVEFQLGAASSLMDGSSDWDECAIAGLNEWNAVLGPTGVRFRAIRASTRIPAMDDGINSVFFADDIFGTPFGAQTLAVTQTFFFSRDGVDEAIEGN